jgi:YidC/Oxa1 family membrane protein insertase
VYAGAFDFLAEIFAWPLTKFYDLTGSYAFSIMLITVVVMAITTPLTLKSTKGMLEMQRLQPEMRRLQQEFRGDRQRLNQEMMALYQEHKVNPLASCFPLLLQMPVFIGMFTLLRGLTSNKDPDGTFAPRIIDPASKLFKDLDSSTQMLSWGLDLAVSPAQMFRDNAAKGILYILFVVLLGVLYWVQQRMVANRSVSPTMSPMQAKLMQYLPVAFAVFQVFFPMGLVLYYIWQTILRIGQQAYITRRFYGHEHALGRQAQAASAAAREIKVDKTPKPAANPRNTPRQPVPAKKATAATTQPKGRPTPRGRPTAPSRPAKPSPAGSARSSGSAKNSTRQPAKPTKPVKPQKPQKPQNPKKPSA